MTARDEWGPWIEHDGQTVPLPIGTPVIVHFGAPDVIKESRVGREWLVPGGSWVWANNLNPIIRYRVRRPRALLDLIEMVETLPSPTEREPA